MSLASFKEILGEAVILCCTKPDQNQKKTDNNIFPFIYLSISPLMLVAHTVLRAFKICGLKYESLYVQVRLSF